MGLKVCIICGVEYSARGSRFSTSKFCSSTCFGKSRRTQVERVCRNCRATFPFNPSQMNTYPNAGRYCSRKCGYEYRVKKNANKPSSDRYGRTRKVADTNWQKAVREKDKSICRRCKKYDPYIHTHHMATRGSRLDLKYEVSNGICLCGPCHQWVHLNPKAAIEAGLLVNTGSN